MAPQTKGSVSSFITSAADAPIWKSYLALRSLTPKNNLMNVSNFGNQSSSNGNLLPLKRVKLLSCRSDVHGPGHAIWMKLNTPLTKQRSDTKDGLAVVISVRDYWKHLSVNERQQILLVDDPELVKQLYKLNIGLLCVGLMQRHLKAVNRLSTSKSKTVVPQRSSSISGLLPTVACILDQVVTLPSTQAATQNSPIEKTYDLLEAMEFLNVDTGILTIKFEVVKDTCRLFEILGDVLTGFLTSHHVLRRSSFYQLFVTESEMINTWPNFQRLIAMLLEQLILRSYVNYLEKQAAHQMEQLLLAASLEDCAKGFKEESDCWNRNKSNRKKKRTLAKFAKASKRLEAFKSKACGGATMSNSDCMHQKLCGTQAKFSEESKHVIADTKISGDLLPNLSYADDDIVEVDEARPAEEGLYLNVESRLNPDALEFQPQGHQPEVEEMTARDSFACEHNFGEYILCIPWDDVESGESTFIGTECSNGDQFNNARCLEKEGGQRHLWRNQRKSIEDFDLIWQLQQTYSFSSLLFGWDFTRQCVLEDPGVVVP